MATSNDDPLNRLLADEIGVNRELLATTLEDKVRIDRNRASFTFLPGMRAQLGTRGTILTALLARKALFLLGADVVEAAEPRDIELISGVKGNTLRPALKQLADRGLVRKNDDGYVVPDFALEDVALGLGEERVP